MTLVTLDDSLSPLASPFGRRLANVIRNLNMSLSDIPNLWVPLALLGLIIVAAVFFSHSS
ncbi:hypothetical protein [Nostoc commune]|uniref:hypothetical protein n=1 Tax=Nostoc commune TaxID=1178 RepID=UPI0018C5F107|nr:hypothetical protein [Nostoc commune]MBG1259073.1 hypothetical protein [Nostoc commune BAE]